MEYLLVHRGGRGCSLEYELLYDGGGDDQLQLMGLIDIEKLQKQNCDDEKLGLKKQTLGKDAQKSVPSQGQVSPKSDLYKSRKASAGKAYSQSGQGVAENAYRAV